jgi:quinol monooxygenase YgiN
VRAGKLEDFEQLFQEGSKSIKSKKPDTLIYRAYANKESPEIIIIHLFPNAKAMDFHVKGADE